jgi:hypothetical protein
LTELIVLNLALDKGVISPALFAMLVIMALVTTFMAGPLLSLVDPGNKLGAPVAEELEIARDRTMMEFPSLILPDKSILVAAQTDDGLRRLVPVGERLARAEPPRELIVARLVRPPQGAAVRGAIGTEAMLLEQTTREVDAIRDDLVAGGMIVVPFGGADHDWAALELAAWLASATQSTLRLCGGARDEDVPRVQRLVDDAAALVRVYAGVETDCTLVEPGLAGLTRAVEGAGLLMIGLSERWRDEGIGPVRSELARTTSVPILFVRRGERPGALAPTGDVTRFTWSRAT